MIQIGQAEQLTLRQAQKIEDDYRIELKANMNDRRCYTTEEQKREYEKEYKAEYYKNNIEYIKRKKNKKYYIKNKDKINEHKQEYKTNNIDKIKAHAREKNQM